MPTEDIQLQQQLDCGKQKQIGLIHTRDVKYDEKAWSLAFYLLNCLFIELHTCLRIIGIIANGKG